MVVTSFLIKRVSLSSSYCFRSNLPVLFQVVEGVYMCIFSKNRKTYQYFTNFTTDC